MTTTLPMEFHSAHDSRASHSNGEVAVLELARQRVELAADISGRCAVAASDQFLLLDLPTAISFAEGPAEQWLRWHSSLEGNAKFALERSSSLVRLRAEIPIEDGANISLQLDESLRGLARAHQVLQGAGAVAAPFVADAPTVPPSAELVDVAREAGFAVQVRSDGSTLVDLPARSETIRALLTADVRGVRAHVELLRSDSASASCRAAVSLLLLRASGAIRFARPFVCGADNELACGFEVRIVAPVALATCVRALEALAVAASSCNAELLSLLEPSVAERYLAIYHHSTTPTNQELLYG